MPASRRSGSERIERYVRHWPGRARPSSVRATGAPRGWPRWPSGDLAAQRERYRIAEEWSRAVRRFVEAIGAINEQIALFNLKAPLPRLQWAKPEAAQEIERLGRGE